MRRSIIFFTLAYLAVGSLGEEFPCGQSCLVEGSGKLEQDGVQYESANASLFEGKSVTFSLEAEAQAIGRFVELTLPEDGSCNVDTNKTGQAEPVKRNGKETGQTCTLTYFMETEDKHIYSFTLDSLSQMESGVTSATLQFDASEDRNEDMEWELQVKKAPQTIQISQGGAVTQVVVGRENEMVTVKCTASGVRPLPTFSWSLDNSEPVVNMSVTESFVEKDSNIPSVAGKVFDATQTITFNATSDMDMMSLFCLVDHPVYAQNQTLTMNDKSANATMVITGPPVPVDGVITPMTGSGQPLVPGEPGTVMIPFHCNPEPVLLQWEMADAGSLGSNETRGRYTAQSWVAQENSSSVARNSLGVSPSNSYFAILKIDEVTSDDAELTHRVSVGNANGNTTYTFQLYVLDEGLSGGAIAGIVIGCLAGVALIAGGTVFMVKKKKKDKAQKLRRIRRAEEARQEGH